MKSVVRVLPAVTLVWALAPLSSPPAYAACISGGAVSNLADCVAANKGKKDCLLAWAVNFDGAGGPPTFKGAVTTKVVCQDGDPCDGDGYANGVCTFEIGACVNAGASTGSCTAATLSKLTIKKPSDKDAANAIKKRGAVFTKRTLANELGALLPESGELCTADNLELKVYLKKKKGVCASPMGQRCKNDQDCDDYCIVGFKKGKSVVKVGVEDAGGSAKDADALKFFCLPASSGSGAAGAEAFQVTDPADLIGGPLAMGRTGDWMLRNGNIRVLVRDVGRQHSFMLTNGGHILDADLQRSDPSEDRDNWLGIQTMVHISDTQATTDILVLNDGSDGNPAILRTTGPDDLFDTISPNVAIFQAGDTLSIPPDTVDNNLPLSLTTDYILRTDTSYVQVATTIENTGSSDLDLQVGDFVDAGGEVEVFGPGLGFGEAMLRLGSSGFQTSPQGLDFLAFQGVDDARGVTYGTVFPRSKALVGINKFVDGTFFTGAFIQSGVAVWAHRQQLLSLLNSAPQSKPTAPFHVAAGGSNVLRRWFVVGDTVNDVTAAREELFGNKVGAIQGLVTSADAPVADARVAFIKTPGNRCAFAGGENCVNVFSATIADAAGFYRAFLPAGLYNVQVRGPGFPYEGSATAPADHFVNLRAKKTAVVDVDLPSTGSLRVTVADQDGSPIAAKVSIVGLQASPDPLNTDSVGGFIVNIGRYFGYKVNEKDTQPHGLVQVRFADHTGDTGSFNIEPGNYHVVVSHGPEYDVFDQPVTVAAGSATTLNATVDHVVDTSGFISYDAHVHLINSPDSAVSRDERIVTMMAEGVDFFVASDHDFVQDLNSDITALGATGLVATAASDEITTFSYGHFNVWPLTVDPSSLIGGALDWGRAGEPVGSGYPSDASYDLLPSEIFAGFNPATQVIQINHINSSTLGHFNNLGIDTLANPPVSSDLIFRCSGGTRPGLPCFIHMCLGGASDGGGCSTNADCGSAECSDVPVGRDCPGGGTCEDQVANLAAFLRMDPAVTNLYTDNYTALEVWIEASRAQTSLLLHDNLGDWAGLLNQGRFKTGVADSDTHHEIVVQAGGPRTYAASATDDPALINPTTVAAKVNEGRAIGSNGPFMRVSLVGDGGAVASHALGDPLTVAATGGAGTVDVHVESPTWAEFDTIELYTNSVPVCHSNFTFFAVVDRVCDLTPDVTLTKGTDFTVTTTTGVSGAGQRLVADVAVPLVLSQDTWVIVVVRGTDGVSRPLFPMNPKDLKTSGNTTLAQLTDGGIAPPWNLGEDGVLATAFSNPLFFDFEEDGLCHGGTPCP